MENKTPKTPKKRKKTTSQNFPKFSPGKRKEIISHWKSFPGLIRRMNISEMQILGLDTAEIKEFLLIKTREELAKYLGVSRRQLYTDEHTKEVEEKIKTLEKKWGGNRTPNIILALYRGAIKEGDAARVKLWFQIFRSWREKQELELESRSKELEELTEAIKQIAEKEYDEPNTNDEADLRESQTEDQQN